MVTQKMSSRNLSSLGTKLLLARATREKMDQQTGGSRRLTCWAVFRPVLVFRRQARRPVMGFEEGRWTAGRVREYRAEKPKGRGWIVPKFQVYEATRYS